MNAANETPRPAGGGNATGFDISLATLWGYLTALSSMRLLILGGAMEGLRRMAYAAWDNLFITVEINSSEMCFQWMLVWLSQQPSWNRSRTLEVVTPHYGQMNMGPPSPWGQQQEHDDEGQLVTAQKLQYQPSEGKKCTIRYKGSWIQVVRNKKDQTLSPYQTLTTEKIFITMFARSHAKLDRLLTEAYEAYKVKVKNRIHIFSSYDQYAGWSSIISRPKRSLKSVVLSSSIKERLLEDAKDFLDNEKWYSERGIPWRRGYLLHGSPGSGKTSLIHALAGELDLNIHVFSLAKRDMDDDLLSKIVSSLPARSIALMEDIDVAFTRGIDRDTSANPSSSSDIPPPRGGVTLSGLLAAIDGVAAQEGRILFATTNDRAALDPALCRPGRLDVHFRFELAGREQAEELFLHFFPSAKEEEDEIVQENSEMPLIDLLPASEKATSPSQAEALSHTQLTQLAKDFAASIPTNEFSMAALQGHLMQFKTRPGDVVGETPAWVERERKAKAEWEEARRRRKEGDVNLKGAGWDASLGGAGVGSSLPGAGGGVMHAK